MTPLKILDEYEPKEYFDNGRTVPHDQKPTRELWEAMKAGEVVTWRDEQGRPFKRMMLDSFNECRSGKWGLVNDGLLQAMFGVPPTPDESKLLPAAYIGSE